MSGISAGERRYRDDDGSADPRVAAALAAFAAGEGSEQAALTALAASRLLVPLVATLAGQPAGRAEAQSGGPAGSDGRARDGAGTECGQQESGGKVSEIALPTLIGRDGRIAIPVFTSLDAMTRWRPGARPVPRAAGLVWRAAGQEARAVMIDVAGPVPLAVEGARLAALASGEPVPPAHLDADIQAAVAATTAGCPGIARADLGPGQAGTDLVIQLTLAAGTGAAAGSELAARLGADVMTVLGSRLRRGIAVAVSPAGLTQPGRPAGHGRRS